MSLPYNAEYGAKNKTSNHEPNIIYKLRCISRTCVRMLGKVDRNLVVHVYSKRSGINVSIEKGIIRCDFCGNVLHWEKGLKKEK